MKKPMKKNKDVNWDTKSIPPVMAKSADNRYALAKLFEFKAVSRMIIFAALKRAVECSLFEPSQPGVPFSPSLNSLKAIRAIIVVMIISPIKVAIAAPTIP